MTDFMAAAKVVEEFEGFISHAQWDVNAFRLGFGSDTRWNGTADVPVRRGDVTTRSAALINLQHRLPKYRDKIVSQVGQHQWDALSVAVQSALLSVAYNYGSLPDGVARAVQIGDAHAIAAAIRAHSHDNNGVNAHRRLAEAAMVMAA